MPASQRGLSARPSCWKSLHVQPGVPARPARVGEFHEFAQTPPACRRMSHGVRPGAATKVFLRWQFLTSMWPTQASNPRPCASSGACRWQAARWRRRSRWVGGRMGIGEACLGSRPYVTEFWYRVSKWITLVAAPLSGVPAHLVRDSQPQKPEATRPASRPERTNVSNKWPSPRRPLRARVACWHEGTPGFEPGTC